MKIPKGIKLLIRLIIIPACLLLITLLLIKAPHWLNLIQDKDQHTAPKIYSFGITIPKGYSVHGIDVSKHQGAIDWKRVSQMNTNGIRLAFVFIKASEGISRQDKQFKTNWVKSSKHGLLRGAYHFYYPSRDANKQADNFIKMVKLRTHDLPPVVDIETSNRKNAKQICDGLQIFLNRLEKEYAVKPIIYTNIHFYNTYLKGKFKEYPLWIAGYFDHDRFYNEFDTPWKIWQHSEKGKVDGIKGNVDFNVFYGDIQMLKKLCI